MIARQCGQSHTFMLNNSMVISTKSTMHRCDILFQMLKVPEGLNTLDIELRLVLTFSVNNIVS